MRATVEANGAYSVRLPGAATYVVRVTSPDGKTEQQILEVSRSTTRDFDLDSGRVSVSVRGPDGSPAPAARIHATDLARGIAVADVQANEQGIAFLPALDAPVRIVATRGGATGSKDFVPGQGSRSVEIVLSERAGLRIDLRNSAGTPVYRATVRVRASRTGADAGPRVLSRSDEQPFEIAVDSDDPVDLVIKAPSLAPRTVYGLTVGQNHTITLSGGLALGVRVSEVIQPCAIQFADSTGRVYGVSTDYPLGRVPFSVREAMFNPIEQGEYTVTLFACTGETIVRPVSVVPGYTAALATFD